ncbi:response regulator [Ktedonosporobacter rubrisoli]|uniref:Response regulator n=1 Tax=Ktedonosporobacter rubrisoli TaxID=2509675 RepID=A0A4P6JPL2_KTERU|nr:response regulator [Ktedonosporobacter rubrisoli]QBD76706.1 response regulator [Ktedonosporobacter rubrisoli]
MIQQETCSPAQTTSPAFKLIIVVEDDADFGACLIQMIREETPYRAIHAHDAFEALRMTGHFKFDLFLLDYQLPGIDGLDLYDLLRSTEGHENVPALFITASSRLPQKELEKRKLHSLYKPFELDELTRTLRELLEPQEA